MSMFSEIVSRTAVLVARWSGVGFTHGVLNTDNMSVAGITIDYGPFGFLDEYNSSYIPNHSDDMGRYDYQSQPAIGRWNLEKLAVALKPLVNDDSFNKMKTALSGYSDVYQKQYFSVFRSKLGFNTEDEDDQTLIDTLLSIMESVEADFTQTFRDLSELCLEDLEELKVPDAAWGLKQCMMSKQMEEWLKLYVERIRLKFNNKS